MDLVLAPLDRQIDLGQVRYGRFHRRPGQSKIVHKSIAMILLSIGGSALAPSNLQWPKHPDSPGRCSRARSSRRGRDPWQFAHGSGSGWEAPTDRIGAARDTITGGGDKCLVSHQGTFRTTLTN